MPVRRLFNSKRRETVWLRGKHAAFTAGRGSLPICPHCELPVFETDDWDECHFLHKSRAFGASNALDNVTPGHHACNLRHGAEVVTPAKAKADRIRRRHIGAARPGTGRHPLPGGRRSGFKIAIGGGTRPRTTSAQRHAAFVASRALRDDDGNPVGVWACDPPHVEG
jgi:hypothetical protein